MAGQNCIYVWSREHRIHHKFSDTDGDPHNINRGAFFSHVGWLLRKKHPEILVKAKTLTFDDLDKNPVVQFQKKYYNWLFILTGPVFSVFVPWYFWDLPAIIGLVVYVSRQLNVLHPTWFVNSAAHMFGDRPYSEKVRGRENLWVNIAIHFMGEGYHNYHHTYPYDYGASEDGSKLNMTKFLIDFWYKLGLAYDLRRADQSNVQNRREALRQNKFDENSNEENNNKLGPLTSNYSFDE